jgi:quercetin dioxygenase-like cupin family protein
MAMSWSLTADGWRADQTKKTPCCATNSEIPVTMQANAFPDLVVVKLDAAPESKPEPGLTRKVMAYNDKLFLAEHQMVKGWVGRVHSHPHDQVVYVVRGYLKVTCQGKTFDIRSGDSFVVRGGVEHGASALEDSVVVDVFTPCREDYIV